MEEMKYLYELFEALPRCGPGENEATRRAFRALRNLPQKPFMLDIGCGPGVQTLELAELSNGRIVALDNHQPFLDKLMKTAREKHLADRIIPKNISMLDMDFDPGTFDVIWSEGALYLMGFQNGLRRCRELLKDHGYLAVTEAVYLSPDPPAPLIAYWQKEYPDIQDIPTRTGLIHNEGYRLKSYFALPESAWLDHFYLPMEKALSSLEKKYEQNKTALAAFGTLRDEIALYHKYSDYFGYAFFVMQKTDEPETVFDPVS